METVALAREIGPRLAGCELTHRRREPIDLDRARAEHAAYRVALAGLGCRVELLPPLPEHPDGVFVEDTAVVLDEVAVIARPGAASRRGEVSSVRDALAMRRPLAAIAAPGTLEGGDVLRVGRRLYVGASSRTNASGRAQLAAIAEPLGYEVRAVEVKGCLHLKTACSLAAPRLLLLDPRHVDASAFEDLERVEVPPEETHAANAVRVGGEGLLFASGAPRTLRRLRALGLEPLEVKLFELAKAEAGLTCCSILIDTPETRTRSVAP